MYKSRFWHLSALGHVLLLAGDRWILRATMLSESPKFQGLRNFLSQTTFGAGSLLAQVCFWRNTALGESLLLARDRFRQKLAFVHKLSLAMNRFWS